MFSDIQNLRRYRELDGKDHFTVISDLADPDSAMVREIMDLVQRETPKGP